MIKQCKNTIINLLPSSVECLNDLLLALPYMANASLGFGFFFVSRSAEVRLRHKFTDWLQFRFDT